MSLAYATAHNVGFNSCMVPRPVCVCFMLPVHGNKSPSPPLPSPPPSPPPPSSQLWMGTHKKGPSTIRYPESLAGMLLSDWLKDNQWALGDKVAADFDGEFPFLFKVLSINRALSIQAHPDKEHARKLHMEAPDKYPDPNHKPEMVIAMREFEGMCGFRPFPAIQEWVMKVPELRKVSSVSTLCAALLYPA